MSWLLIILLVLVFIMFALSCIVIVAWVATGTPNLTLSSSSDPQPSPAVTDPKATTSDESVDEEENRLVQTLYVGGKAAVTRTTNFTNKKGPMNIKDSEKQKDIVHWYDPNQKLDDNSETKIDMNALLSESQTVDVPKRPLKNVKQDYMALRRTQRSTDETLNSSRFRVAVRNRCTCDTSSTLQLPVQLFVPIEYAASPSALAGRTVQWVIHRVHQSDDSDNDDDDSEQEEDPKQSFLWQSNPISLQEMCALPEHVEVDTTLECRTIAQWLLRLKLIDAKSKAVLASAFFNPSAIISKGPMNFGTDIQNAWHNFRLHHKT